MQEVNDIGAPRTHYEYALQQARMPRQFWALPAQELEFTPMSVLIEHLTPAQLRAKQKAGDLNVELTQGSKGAVELSVWSQERISINFFSFLKYANLRGRKALGVFFCPDLKRAQRASMMLMHEMLGSTYQLAERPYQVEVVRSFEIANRRDPLPDVVVIPALMAQIPNSVAAAFSQLIRRNHIVIVSTNQTPQQFYDAYGVLPNHPYCLR